MRGIRLRGHLHGPGERELGAPDCGMALAEHRTSGNRIGCGNPKGAPTSTPEASLDHKPVRRPFQSTAQLQSKDFDARRRLESRCLGIPCAPRKCTRVFFRLLVGYQPQLLKRAHDAALGPQSLSSPQPNKSRLNTCHGFFHSAQRCLSRWGPAPTEAVASTGREAAQTGPGRACQHGRITQD